MRGSNRTSTGGNEVEHELATGPIGTWFRRIFWGSMFVAWCLAGYQGIEFVHHNVDRVMEWVMPAAHGAERNRPYQSADESEWFTSLMQPDTVSPTSCCGYGDAYHADDVEPCKIADGKDCWLVAIITDARPDRFEVSDGKGGAKIINRPHLDMGTRIVVPKSKRRRVPTENPTDHGIIFAAPFNAYDDFGGGTQDIPPSNLFTVYCFEPLGGL